MTPLVRRTLLLSCLTLAWSGCDGERDPMGDAGVLPPRPDAGPTLDAGPILDAGPGDDAGTTDAATTDAGPAGPIDPSRPGARTVTTRTDTVSRPGRSTPVVAYVPDGAPTPLVVFAPGFRIPSASYVTTLEHLASHGFTVVRADPEASIIAPNHVAMRDDLVAVIDWALAELSPSAGVLVMGHSLGGKVATMVAGQDGRVTALLGIDPVNGGVPFFGYTANVPDVVPSVTQTVTVPAAYLGETTNATGGIGGMPCAPMDENFQTFFSGTTASPSVYEFTFAGADHIDFLDTEAGCGTPCSACTPGTADTDAVSASTRTLLTAFALRHLRSETSVEGWLTGTRALPGVTVRTR